MKWKFSAQYTRQYRKLGPDRHFRLIKEHITYTYVVEADTFDAASRAAMWRVRAIPQITAIHTLTVTAIDDDPKPPVPAAQEEQPTLWQPQPQPSTSPQT